MKQKLIENDIDLTNIVSIQNSSALTSAILNTRGSKKQFTFGWCLSPLHETSLQPHHYENLLAGIKEIPRGEILTFISSCSGNPNNTIEEIQTKIKPLSSKEDIFFIQGLASKIKELSNRGERKERKYYIFATYTVDLNTIEAEDFVERATAKIISYFKKDISKSDTLDIESTSLMLQRALDAWSDWQTLLETKIGLKIRSLNKEELWEYLRYQVNGETWRVPLPHSLTLNGQGLHEIYHLKTKKKIAVKTNRLHMSSLIIGPDSVPKAGQKFYLPGRKAYVGIVKIKQLPEGFIDEQHALNWLWKEIVSQDQLIDFEIISQFSRVNERDAMKAAQDYAEQQDSMQRLRNRKGRRDRIAEFRSEEAGDVQVGLLQGDIPLNIGIAICIYVYVDHEADRKKAHQSAIEKLSSKVNFVKNRFKAPAAGEQELNYPWRVWLQTIPFTTSYLYAKPYDFRHPINANAAVGFIPCAGINARSKSGIELISERGSTPVNLSLNDSFGSPRHFVIFGKTGSGKSTLVALFIIQALTDGIPVTIMDYPKGKAPSTYTWMMKFFGGEEYDTGNTSNNLLEYINLANIPPEDHKVRLADFCNNVTNIITSLVLDGEEDTRHSKTTIRSLIQLGVTQFYNNPQILERCHNARAAGLGTPEWDNWPTLHDYYELFEAENLSVDEFGTDIKQAIKYIRYRIFTWLKSDLGKAIAAPSSFDGSSNLTLFAVRNISSNQEAAILALSAQTAAMRKALASPRSLFYCDELSVLMRFSNLAYVIGSFLATGRAIGLSVLLASQDPEALQNAPKEVAAQITQNLSCRLIGRISSRGAIKSYQEIFGYAFETLAANASEDFIPSVTAIFSRWLVDDEDQITPCRYYPTSTILGIVANNSNEVSSRDLFFQRYPNKYEALGRFSHWLQTKFRSYTAENDEIITAADIENLKAQLFPENSSPIIAAELSLAK
jgi:hypothetical protein